MQGALGFQWYGVKNVGANTHIASGESGIFVQLPDVLPQTDFDQLICYAGTTAAGAWNPVATWFYAGWGMTLRCVQ
jgi:hypothetical protein